MLTQAKWLRLLATTFCSNWFFIISLFVGGWLCERLLNGFDDFGHPLSKDQPVPKLVSVLATVPDNEKPDHRKLVLVFVTEMGEFEEKNPEYSFLLPTGEGELDNPESEMITRYKVKEISHGKIVVESKFHHDVPPAGLDVAQRYEATDKDIKILNAKYGLG